MVLFECIMLVFTLFSLPQRNHPRNLYQTARMVWFPSVLQRGTRLHLRLAQAALPRFILRNQALCLLSRVSGFRRCSSGDSHTFAPRGGSAQIEDSTSLRTGR